MSISTARGCLNPDVTPPVDRATIVFLFVSYWHFPTIFLPFRRGKRYLFQPLWGVLDQKTVMSLFDSMISFGIVGRCNFWSISHRSKIVWLRVACKMSSGNFWGRDSSLIIFVFIDCTQNVPPSINPCWLRHEPSQSAEPFDGKYFFASGGRVERNIQHWDFVGLLQPITLRSLACQHLLTFLVFLLSRSQIKRFTTIHTMSLQLGRFLNHILLFPPLD
jgi:hypothetical protein